MAEQVHVHREGLTVGSNLLLWLYTKTHSRDYTVRRVTLPPDLSTPSGETAAVAYLMVPGGDGPHPTVIVFPILGGNHIVSELLAKALVNRGFAVARLERRALEFETEESRDALAERFSGSIRDARRLIDWLVTQPEIDGSRLASAGASLGGILACLLHEVDDRVRAGFFLLAGGGLAEIVHDSAEAPVRVFRNRMLEREDHGSRDEFVRWMHESTLPVDPLAYAGRVDPESVLMITGRYDRVIPGEQSRLLWEALGHPRWIRLPVGHYQGGMFLWWAAGRGAAHFERVLNEEEE